MDDYQTPIRPRFGQGSRGPTRLKRLSLRRAASEKTHVDIDINTEVVSGLNAEMFNNYLGVLSCEKLFILINSWDNVLEVDRNML